MDIRLFIFVVGGLILFVGTIICFQRRLIYPVRHVNKNVVTPSATRIILKREVGDFHIEAWLLLPKQTPKGLVVHVHGNGEYLDAIEENFLHYTTSEGWAVLMPEYRGYSRSGGNPTEESIGEDCVYFLREVLKKYPNLANKLVYHGRSLGGGIVSDLARKIEPRALILESTFTSLANVAHERFFVPTSWVWDQYDTNSYLKTFNGPVLIIHGRQDPIVTFSHAERNAATGKHVTFVPFEGHHSDTMLNNLTAYRAAIAAFLRKIDLKN